MYQVIARKYRPQKFSEVVGQEHITRTIQNAITAGRLHHAYLFTGVRGVGKTTLARIFSKALNCEKGPAIEPCNKCPACLEITSGASMDVQEIDGASNTGVDDVREIREKVKYLPSKGRYKIYIIDEVHMLSVAAFNALLKTLEEPPAHVIFIFATTEAGKIPATILSRCQRYDFRRIALPKIVSALKQVAESEKVEVEEQVLSVIAHEAEGSMRDAQSLFDQAVAFSGKKLTLSHLKELLGFLDRSVINKTISLIVERDAKGLIQVVEDLFNSGANLSRFVTELLSLVKNLLVAKSTGSAEEMDLLEDEKIVIKEILPKITVEECNQWFNLLYKGAEDISRTKSPKILTDVLMIRLSQIRPVSSLDDLIARVEKASKSVQSPKAETVHPTTPVATSAAPVQNKDFLSWLKGSRPQVASILEHSLEYKCNENKFVVKFSKGSLYGDMLTEPERKDSFEKLLADFYKKKIYLNIEFVGNGSDGSISQEKMNKRAAEERNKAVKEEALAHEIVRETANLFGAEIKDIKVKA